MMRFSIVIPTYNYGHVLERAVVSACAQPGDDFEVIVIDDGSTDNTPEVLERLRERYPDLRVSRQANAGPAAVRNRGVDETSGDYLIFLDADDELLPGALAAFTAAHRARPQAGMLIARAISVFPDGREETGPLPALSDDPERRFLDYLYKDLRLSNGAVAMHRSLFGTVRYNGELRQTEDIPVFAQALVLQPCAAVDEAVVRIHKHGDSLRHDPDIALSVGMRLVDEVFNPRRLPPALMHHRARYRARRALSLFRICYKGRRYDPAARFFRDAWRTDKAEALARPGYLLKYLRCLWKRRLIQAKECR